MVQPKKANAKTKPRADALRNRERIFAVAKACFADESAVYGMEDIARKAGVGVGSLYRAFGNRAGLAEAVFKDMVDELAALAADLAGGSNKWSALKKFLEAYVDQLISKRSIMRELQPLFDQDPHLREDSGRLASRALEVVLEQAKGEGFVRAGVRATDILQLINATVRAGTNDERRVGAMLRIILDGIRSPKTG